MNTYELIRTIVAKEPVSQDDAFFHLDQLADNNPAIAEFVNTLSEWELDKITSQAAIAAGRYIISVTNKKKDE